MPTITDQAIVIRRWDFSESSQTVSLFTREHGVVRGLAKGAKREKGDFSGGMDLLTRGEAVAIVKPGREMATITAWHLQELYRPLRLNLAANRLGLYMADLIHHMLIDHDPHPRMFDVFADCLAMLAERTHQQLALARMQWTLLEEAGYSPSLDRDVHTGASLHINGRSCWFNVGLGGVTAEPIAEDRAGQQWQMRSETLQTLRQVADGSSTSTLQDAMLFRANRLLAAYLRELIGSEPATMRWAISMNMSNRRTWTV